MTETKLRQLIRAACQETPKDFTLIQSLQNQLSDVTRKRDEKALKEFRAKAK